MKIAICVRAIQTDGSTHFGDTLGLVLQRAGHEVSIVSPYPRKIAAGTLSPGLEFCSIAPGRWESESAYVRGLGRCFKNRQFEVVFIVAGLPIPELEQAVADLPDDVFLVPIVVGDREHVYKPTQRTSSFWNVAVAISPRLQQQAQMGLPGKSVRLLTTGIPLPSEEELAQRVLTIVGHGEDRASLEQACRESEISHLIRFDSAPSQADLYRIYREHHISLLTSEIGEGLGLVLLEAQANGCVPVASNIPGVTNFAIENGSTGLLAEIGNPDAFAEQVARLANETQWQAMSIAASARMSAHFSLDHMGQDYAGLLEELKQGLYPLSQSRSCVPRPANGFRSVLPGPIRRLIDQFIQIYSGF